MPSSFKDAFKKEKRKDVGLSLNLLATASPKALADEDDELTRGEDEDHIMGQDSDLLSYPGVSLSEASPLLFLRHLYLFIDPSLASSCSSDDDDSDQNPRHALACSAMSPTDLIRKVPFDSAAASFLSHNFIIKEAFEKYGVTAAFFHLKGDFGSVLLLETPLSAALISCTTSIYSYTDKILETKEVKPVYRDQPQTCSHIYKFDFVHDYWTAFLNGFQLLDNAEHASVAMESLTMVQTFHAVKDSSTYLPLLCLCYEFQMGDGSVTLSRLVL
ncbi:hypothetical protein HDV03_004148 [Kappamyces sp. JEL0829]|nr:hypothetical protein HDV03_004148 [Kappamyces sp. JEL0829]